MNLTEFPEHTLPDEVTNYINAVERANGLIPDLLYPSAIANFSGLLGASVFTRITTDWKVYCSLWLAIVGDSGIKKSPTINSMIRPIRNIDSSNYLAYKESLAEFSALDPDVRKTMTRPVQKRLSIGDATFEAIQNEMYHNQMGLLIDKDEILGFFLDLNRYRPSGNEEALLSIYSGQPMDIARKTSESMRIEKPYLSMIGGIQPGRIEDLLTEERFASGFASRILFTFPQRPVVKRGNRSDFSKELDAYSNLCHRLYELRKRAESLDGQAIELKLAPGAMGLYNDWVDQFIDTKRNAHTERESVKSYVSKLEETCIRIATILECVWSAHYKRVPEVITLQSLEYAIDITENYFFAHFMRVLQSISETVSLDDEFYLRLFYDEFKKQIPEEDKRAFVIGLLRKQYPQSAISKALKIPKSTISTWKTKAFS